jgi:hypothetical protein
METNNVEAGNRSTEKEAGKSDKEETTGKSIDESEMFVEPNKEMMAGR